MCRKQPGAALTSLYNLKLHSTEQTCSSLFLPKNSVLQDHRVICVRRDFWRYLQVQSPAQSRADYVKLLRAVPSWTKYCWRQRCHLLSWPLSQCLTMLTVKSSSLPTLYLIGIFLTAICFCCLLSYPSPRRGWLYLLHTLLLRSWRQHQPRDFSSPAEQPTFFQPLLTCHVLWPPDTLVALCWTCSSILMSFKKPDAPEGVSKVVTEKRKRLPQPAGHSGSYSPVCAWPPLPQTRSAGSLAPFAKAHLTPR